MGAIFVIILAALLVIQIVLTTILVSRRLDLLRDRATMVSRRLDLVSDRLDLMSGVEHKILEDIRRRAKRRARESQQEHECRLRTEDAASVSEAP